MYCFANNYSHTTAIAESSVENNANGVIQVTSSETVSDYYSYCREVCLDSLNRHINVIGKIGGPGEIVEIDETKIGKRKYNRGRLVEGTWVLGGICRNTKEVFMVTVATRDAATLLHENGQHVADGSTIHTDMWRAYANISQQNNYTHLTVNHSINFVGK